MEGESDRLEQLRQGDFVDTPGANLAEVETPEWLDKEKFYQARGVYKTHFASINFSHLCGLLLSFYFTKNIETLKSTGNSSTKKNLFHRYVQTVRHVQSWYEGDVWDIKNLAHKSVAKVRAMHAKVASKMKSKEDGIVYVSQWDMALTQWAFIGPILLFPSQLGLHGLTREDFEALIHFWRGVGYLLGVEDQYNLCHGNYDDVIATCNKVYLEEYRPQVVAADPKSVSMAKSVTLAFREMDSLFTWGCLSNYIHGLANLPCPEVLNWLDWICYSIMHFMMTVALQYAIPRLLLNQLLKYRLEKADKEVDTFQTYKSFSKAATVQVTAG